VSSIAASIGGRTDSLLNEEIIALEVLGDSLSRGDECDQQQGSSSRGDSSIEEDGTMMMPGAINGNDNDNVNDNVSSSSCD